MNYSKLFLVRHAEYENSGNGDPSLSLHGKDQALKLAQAIKKKLNGENLTIWTSTAERTKQTAKIIQSELEVESLEEKRKLWSNARRYDFDWLFNELNEFSGDALIIVSHYEYVRNFPTHLGLPMNYANYAEGICTESDSDTFEMVSHSDV